MTKNISLEEYKAIEGYFYANNPSATAQERYEYMTTYMRGLEDKYYKDLYDKETPSSQEAEEE
jgi:patatin-like phospholipase/acyl hydrolase